MIRYECDKCGTPLSANDPQRYIVKMEIFAAAGALDLDDRKKSKAGSGEELANIMEQLAKADPDDVEDETYRSFRFDLCDDCRKRMIAQPLGS